MYFMLDNYDSFVYNLSAYVKRAGTGNLKGPTRLAGGRGEAMNPEGIIISRVRDSPRPTPPHALPGPVRR